MRSKEHAGRRRIAEPRERLADPGQRSAEPRESLESIEGTGAAAAGLRRQLLDRLREAVGASEELSRSLATATLERTEARSRLEQSIRGLEWQD